MADVYLDRMRDLESVVPFVREPPDIHGIRVDMAKHPAAFHVARPQAPPPYSLPQKVTPRVPMRDATPDETPSEAASAAWNARARGYLVRVTYAQSGEDPPKGADRGRCACGAVVRLYVEDGNMFGHNVPPIDPCPGIVATEGICDTCGAKAKPLKRGGLSKHASKPVACQWGGEAPIEIVDGETADPDQSVVVRVDNVAAGAWTNGSFDFAVIAGKGPVDAREFKKFCKGELT